MATTVNLRNDNITASAKTANLLANTDLAFSPEDGTVNVWTVSSAAGVNIEMGVQSDKVITDREILFIGTTIDKSAHLLASFDVAGGAPMSLFYRETAAAATTDIITIVEHTPFSEQ